MLDIAKVVNRINETRASSVRLITNDGRKLDLPPGTHAFYDQFDLYLHWPSLDPSDPFRASPTMTVAMMNVASIESVRQEATG